MLRSSKVTVIKTNEEHRFLGLDQLREFKKIEATSLLEPAGRNTAPALMLTALNAVDEDSDPILVVTPADQTIEKGPAFNLHEPIKMVDLNS